MLSPSCSRVRFGVFELNLKTRELCTGTQTTLLQEQPYRLLLLLLERGTEVATREEIQTTLWNGDTVIDFERGINAAVKNLRRVLNDSPHSPSYIETMPRLGYRLVVPVEWIESPVPAAISSKVNGNGALGSGLELLPANGADQKISLLPMQEEPARERRALRPWPHVTLIAVVAIAIIGIAAFFVIRMLTADRRPQAARLDGSTLIVTNADGKELWRKTFPEGFSHYFTRDPGVVWVGDLNGDGHSEVLLSYHPDVKPSAHSSVLICYSDRGKEMWRWTPGRAIPELNGDPATFYITGFGVLKATGPHSRIVVSSGHTLWYPHQVAILDSSGKLLSEYWHSGHLDHLTLADLDGDGREEIVATGISNGYRQATLVVLDPDRVFGASIEAARPELQIHGMGVAQERIRLLFPRSDVNMALDSYNVGQEATVGGGDVRFWTLECRQRSWGCPIVYEFDSQFRLRSATADDSFRGFHNEFFRTDKHPHLFSAEEEKQFQRVRCLVGCKTEFVPVVSH